MSIIDMNYSVPCNSQTVFSLFYTTRTVNKKTRSLHILTAAVYKTDMKIPMYRGNWLLLLECRN
jgi:hypothetical protein